MNNKSKDVVITAAVRTPIGTFKGLLKDISANKLGAISIKKVIHRSKLDLFKTSFMTIEPK